MGSESRSFYRPLLPGSIRVLQLEDVCLIEVPGQRLKSTGIKCRLQSALLSELATGISGYEALSYCWGASTNYYLRYILCDGEVVPVTVNLFNALYQLLHDGVGPLWVDALCINQYDRSETARQIGMMGDIFRQARMVIVWLGPGAEASGNQEGDFWLALHQGKSRAQIPAQAISAGVTYLKSCEWFHRLWCFQEIVLAQSARVQCGPYHVVWDALAEYGCDVQSIELINVIRTSSKQLSLYELIEGTADRKCSLPKDRILSLLGLWRGDEVLCSNAGWSAPEIFARTAFVTATELNYLLFLDFEVPRFQFIGVWFGGDRTVVRPNQQMFAISSPEQRTTWVPSWHTLSVEAFDKARAIAAVSMPYNPDRRLIAAEEELEEGETGKIPGIFVSPFLEEQFKIDMRLDGKYAIMSGALLGMWVEPSSAARNSRYGLGCSLPLDAGTFRPFPRHVATDRLGDLVPRDTWGPISGGSWKEPKIPSYLLDTETGGYHGGRLLRALDKDASDRKDIGMSTEWDRPLGERRFLLCVLFGHDALIVVRPAQEAHRSQLKCDLIGALGGTDEENPDIWARHLRCIFQGVVFKYAAYRKWKTGKGGIPSKDWKAKFQLLDLNWIPIQFAISS